MEETKTWQIALIQSDIAIGDPVFNNKHLENQMVNAVSGHMKPDIIVLPEMWNTGYALDQIHELADPEGQESAT